MIRPISARQLDFGVAPVAGQLRHQSRHDRNNRIAPHECDDVVATGSARPDRFDSRLRAEPFGMTLADCETIPDQPQLGHAVVDTLHNLFGRGVFEIGEQASSQVEILRLAVVGIHQREVP